MLFFLFASRTGELNVPLSSSTAMANGRLLELGPPTALPLPPSQPSTPSKLSLSSPTNSASGTSSGCG
eukprot:9493491-Pyramimonas_sp.AAC.1